MFGRTGFEKIGWSVCAHNSKTINPVNNICSLLLRIPCSLSQYFMRLNCSVQGSGGLVFLSYFSFLRISHRPPVASLIAGGGL
jgi:hypothetical protein